MKSETKDNILLIVFVALVIFNIFAVGANLGSCLCSVGDMDCVEACEQKIAINHAVCFAVNIISLVGLGIMMLVWSKENGLEKRK